MNIFTNKVLITIFELRLIIEYITNNERKYFSRTN